MIVRLDVRATRDAVEGIPIGRGYLGYGDLVVVPMGQSYRAAIDLLKKWPVDSRKAGRYYSRVLWSRNIPRSIRLLPGDLYL